MKIENGGATVAEAGKGGSTPCGPGGSCLGGGSSPPPHAKHIREEEQTMYTAHNYEKMTPEKRPQDPGLDGQGWTFELLEHGGEYPDSMPQAIKATDPKGKSCTYIPITVDGKVVDSQGFVHDSREGAQVQEREGAQMGMPFSKINVGDVFASPHKWTGSDITYTVVDKADGMVEVRSSCQLGGVPGTMWKEPSNRIFNNRIKKEGDDEN
jgi:hypothetical protein